MKISEFKSPTNEGIGGAAIKSLFTGKPVKNQLTQDIFLKDFYGDAVTSLSNAVKSGIVNPKLVTPAPTPKVAPNSGPASTAVPTTPPAAPTAPAAATVGPTPTSATSASPGVAPNPAVVDPKVAADAVSALVNLGVKQADAQRSVQLAGAKLGQGANVQSIVRAVLSARDNSKSLEEARYSRLDALFESIVEAEEPGAQTIAQYMMAWFTQYMSGVNWKVHKPKIQQLVKNIEMTYAKDKGKQAIKQLGMAAYAISGPSKTMPAGAQNAGVQSTTGNTFGTSGLSDQQAAEYMRKNPDKAAAILKNITGR